MPKELSQKAKSEIAWRTGLVLMPPLLYATFSITDNIMLRGKIDTLLFASRDSERLFLGQRVRRFQALERAARRKLQMLHAAATLEFLAALSGNRLEALRGDRQGQHSIRINDQYRICFVWAHGDVYDVEIVDYH